MSETNIQLFPGVFRSVQGGANPDFFLHSAGRVGIGNQAPATPPAWDANTTFKLNVTGHTHINGNLDVSGSVYGDGSNMTGVALPWVQSAPNVATDIKYEAGNVGIGGAAGTKKLTVHGDINFSGELYQGGSPYVSTPWTIETNPDAITYTSGNVAIGTTSTDHTLTVEGDALISNGTISTTTTDGGTFQWCLRASGRPRDDSAQGESPCITNDGTGNVYVTGSFQRDATLYDKDDIVRGSITTPRVQPFIIKYSYSGDIQWYTHAASSTANMESRDGAVDTNGNYYIAGLWGGTEINFYNQDGTVGDTITTTDTSTKGYLVKYNASGSVQWSTHFITTGGGSYPYTRVTNVDTDAENIYVVGQFGSGTGSTLDLYNEDNNIAGTLSNTGNADSFIAKYNSSGVLQWRARLGGSGDQYTSTASLSIDNNGNIYVTAIYSGAQAFYNKDDTQAATLNSSGLDAYITKYNSSGYHQWSAGLSGSGNERGYNLTTSNDGAVYVTGSYTSNPMIFYNEDGLQGGTLTRTGNNEEAFIAKYNSSGVLQWRTRIAGASVERGEDISVDSTGNVYITGTMFTSVVEFYNKDDTVANTSSFNNSNYRGYITKYDSNGYFVWRQVVTGQSSACRINSVAIGNDDNVYFTGTYFIDRLEFYNNGIVAATLGRIDDYPHVFVARYSGIGNTTIINSKESYDAIALNTNGGNVGIGTNAPRCALEVNGDIHFSGRISGPGFTTYKSSGSIKHPSYYFGNEVYANMLITESVGTVYYSVKSQTNASRSHGSFDYAIIGDTSSPNQIDWSTKAVAHKADTNTSMHIIAKIKTSGYNVGLCFLDSGGTTSAGDYDWEAVVVKYAPFTH